MAVPPPLLQQHYRQKQHYFMSMLSARIVILSIFISSYFPISPTPTLPSSSSLSSSLVVSHFPSVLFAYSSFADNNDDSIIVDDEADEDPEDFASMAPAATSPGASAGGGGGGYPPSAASSSPFPSSGPPRRPGPPPPSMPSEEELRSKAKKRVKVASFSPPKIRESFHYLETFQTTTTTGKGRGALGGWIKSGHPKFTGPWELSRRRTEGLEGDVGLKVGSSAEFHGIAGRMPDRVNKLEDEMRYLKEEGGGEASSSSSGSSRAGTVREVVIQYEAKFENDLHCGGAYIKLFDLGGAPLDQFNAETDYVVMFGPDRCGETDKVHCIIKIKNPHTGKTTEHHLKSPPKVPQDNVTHLYTLRLKSDDTVEMWIDNKLAKSGHLSVDMDPPMLPVKEIEDVHAVKPEDWDVPMRIPDPYANKPEDWDDTQSSTINDPEARLPEGWLLDEPLLIPDPHATKPDDWNDESSGPWNAPTIENPSCTVGCGEWTAPLVDNPLYKGTWQAPMIDNADFAGTWIPPKIANPEYFEQPLFALGPVDSAGFELWTMQAGLMFDNILVGSNFYDAQEFAKETWEIRSTVEAEMNRVMREIAQESITEAAAADGQTASAGHPWHTRTLLQAQQLIEDHGSAVLGTSVSVIVVLLGMMLRRRQRSPSSSPAAGASSTCEKSAKCLAEDAKGEEAESAEEEEEDGADNNGMVVPKEAAGARERRTTRSRARAEEGKGGQQETTAGQTNTEADEEGEEQQEKETGSVRKRKPQKS
eukprot:GHVS01049895.1.p1 GENE.GHVS01049895.1~~GHVS01049895.1.p1  ORF type:complete len:760 (+),score=179.45 GHVS01049895.1:154-2433(+)